MKISVLKFWTILIIGLSSFGWTVRPKGEFKYYWWDGRHGHHRLIKINSNKYKYVSWSSNFFRPTKIEIIGQVIVDQDSIVFIPKRIEFYRRQEGSKGATDKKLKCTCDENGLKAIDKEKEWYIIKSCDRTKYFFNLDTLTEAKTEFRYIRQ